MERTGVENSALFSWHCEDLKQLPSKLWHGGEWECLHPGGSPWEHKVVTHEWVETLVEEIDKEGKQLGKAQADMDKMLAWDSKPGIWGVQPPVKHRKFPVNKHFLTHRWDGPPYSMDRLVLMFIRLTFHTASMADHGENISMLLNWRNRKLNLQLPQRDEFPEWTWVTLISSFHSVVTDVWTQIVPKIFTVTLSFTGKWGLRKGWPEHPFGKCCLMLGRVCSGILHWLWEERIKHCMCFILWSLMKCPSMT